MLAFSDVSYEVIFIQFCISSLEVLGILYVRQLF